MNKNCRLLNLFEKTIRSVNFLHRIGPRSKCLVGCSPAKAIIGWRFSLLPRTVWPDWAKFRRFGKLLFGNIFEAWLVFGNILYWQFFKIGTGQMITVVNSQILKNEIAIWSHWPRMMWLSLTKHFIVLSTDAWNLAVSMFIHSCFASLQQRANNNFSDLFGTQAFYRHASR